MPILQTLESLGGAARREQLLARGVRRAEIAGALSRGTVVRPHRGCYAIPGTPRAVVLAVVFRASLACVTAAEALGLPVLERSEATHLVVENERGLARPGVRPMGEVRLHQSHTATSGDRRVVPWVVVDQAGLCVSPLTQLAMLDAALNRRLMTTSDLRRFSVTPGAVLGYLRKNCDARAESLLETIARVRLRDAGLAVEPQVRIQGVGRVDLLVENRVVVELDGRAFHESAESFAKDRARDRGLQARGLLVARFTYDEVVARPGLLEATVRELTRRARLVAA